MKKFLFIILFFTANQLLSQTIKIDSSKIVLQIDYGVEGAVVVNQPNGIITSIRDQRPCCYNYKPVVSVNWGIAGFGTYHFPWATKLFTAPRLQSLRFSLGYDNLNTGFASGNNIYESFDTLKPSFKVDTTQQFIDYSLDFFRLAGEINFELLNNFTFSPGFSLNLPISGKSLEREVLVGPTDALFQNGKKERIIRPSTGILNDINTRLGIAARLAFKIPVKKLFIEPFLSVDYGFGTIQPDWQLLIGRGGISIGGTYREYGFDTIPPPPKDTTPPPKPYAEVGMYVAAQVQPIEFKKEIISRYIPLLPVVFFNQNSYEIPARYVNSSVSMNLVEEDLPPNAEIAHHSILDIVGSRLTKNPNAKIVLTGTTSIDENYRPSLSRERAKSVKKYLVDVWDIDEKRISLKFSLDPTIRSNSDYAEGKEENRRVDMYFTENALYKPIQIRNAEPSNEPESIPFNTQIVNNCKIDSWYAIIKTNSKTDTLTGFSLPKDTILWNLTADDRRAVLNGSKIYYQMFLVNKEHNLTFSSKLDSVKTKVDTKISLLQKDNKAEFLLVTFDYNRAKLTPRGQEELKEIISRLTPESKLEIIGYTDKLGNETRNNELAADRAEEITRLMPKPIPITTRGAKANEAPYSVETPEGRFLSRTVRVIMTNPK